MVEHFCLSFYLPDHFTLLFTICFVVSLGVVCFYAKRHPNPHFRPGKREILMVSLFLLMTSGGGCWITARMLESDIDPEKIGEQVENSKRQAFREKGTVSDATVAIQSGLSAPADLPEKLPEEIREVVNPQ